MKVHRITLYVIDFDGIGADGCKETLEDARYPNDCMSPHVVSTQTADIGEWHDDHPLNKLSTASAEIERIFARGGE